MTNDELRAAVLAEMFLGLGSDATDNRIGYYLRLLANVPPSLLRVACDCAVLQSDSGYPPSPGAIIRQAERINRERRVEERERSRREIAEAERAAVLRDVAARESIEAGEQEDPEKIAGEIERSLRLVHSELPPITGTEDASA